MENGFKPLAKSVSIPLGVTTAASATDAAIHKKMFGSRRPPFDITSYHSNLASRMTTLIISNDEKNDIMKIVQSLEESRLLTKEVSEIIKDEAKEQKVGFFSTLLGTLGASLLGNLLTGKGTIKAGEDTIQSWSKFLIPPIALTNFEIQKYYQNESKFNGVYSKNNLPKIKDGANVKII